MMKLKLRGRQRWQRRSQKYVEGGIVKKEYENGEDMKMNGEFGLISVIMAAYNAEATIEKAIDSVLTQTYQDFELLVVDDYSSDRTVKIIESLQKNDKRIVLIKNQKNYGVSVTRKRAADKAKGKWIAILDSDDIWKKDKLEKQIQLLIEKNADLVYTGSEFINEKGKKMNWYLNVPNNLMYRDLLKQNLISNSSALVRKELYIKYYIENDKIHEDFAIWLRILRERKKAYGVNEPLLIYRVSKKSKSGNKIKAAKMNWNTYRSIGLNYVLTFYYECWYVIHGINKYRKLRKYG